MVHKFTNKRQFKNVDMEFLYLLIKDSEKWPDFIKECKKVELVEYTSSGYIRRMESVVNNKFCIMETDCRFDDAAHVMTFTQLKSPWPIKSNHGVWSLTNSPNGSIEMKLIHEVEARYGLLGDILLKLIIGHFYIYNHAEKVLDNFFNYSRAEMEAKNSGNRYYTKSECFINANTSAIFEALKNVMLWPEMFEPCEKAVLLEGDGVNETIQLTSLTRGKMFMWTSVRKLDSAGKTIEFSQTTPSYPLQEMSGKWIIEETDCGAKVTFLHTFSLKIKVFKRPMAAIIKKFFVDTNSDKELYGLKKYCEKLNV